VFIIFARKFGPALFVPAAQTMFTRRLKDYLEEFVPGPDSGALANMVLQDLNNCVGCAELGGLHC
jgi:hypothetical protein